MIREANASGSSEPVEAAPESPQQQQQQEQQEQPSRRQVSFAAAAVTSTTSSSHKDPSTADNNSDYDDVPSYEFHDYYGESDGEEEEEEDEDHLDTTNVHDNDIDDVDKEDPSSSLHMTKMTHVTPTRHSITNSSRRRMGSHRQAFMPFQISYKPQQRIMFYSPPLQRQKWGDKQVLPRTNWGDLFFDLHYVAATYNVSTILVQEPTATGLLYAAATFLPIMYLWVRNTHYASRFVTDEDIVHRLQQMAVLIVLATAVLHVRTVDILSRPQEFISPFVFSLCLVLEQFLHVLKYIELYFRGKGQRPVLRKVALRELRATLLTTVFYLAAAIVAGREYYAEQSEYNGGDQEETTSSSSYEEDTADAHRFLAPSTSSNDASPTNNLPMWLCLAGFLSFCVYFAVDVILLFPKGGQHKQFTVPMNVDFFIHRQGEWTMLMLGESIFSILIVDVANEDREYFGTFYASTLTVILLQFLHFKSQPHSAHGHAMRRNKDAGVAVNLLAYVYSLALVCLGAAFTFFLAHFNDNGGGTTDSYDTVKDDSNYETTLDQGDEAHRWLAGDETTATNTDVTMERASHLFAGSLAVSFFCLDAMTLFHLGLKQGYDRCVAPKSGKVNVAGVVVVLARMGLMALTASLSSITQEPEKLSFLGMSCVILQLILRKMGAKFLSHAAQVHAMKNGHSPAHKNPTRKQPTAAAWPNVTAPIAEPSSEIKLDTN